MALGRWIAAAAMLFSSGAWAQQPSTANMGITPTTTPEVLSVLDVTKNWVVVGTVDSSSHTFTPVGTSGGGSSYGSVFPTTGTPIGAEYLSSPPTLTPGTMAAPQLNINGAMKVDGSSVSQPVTGTFWQATQPISAASLPLPAGAATSSTFGSTFPATGTAGGGQYLTSAPTLTNGNMGPLLLDVNGNLKVNVVVGGGGGGGGGASSSFGAPFPASGTAIGLTNGTTMIPWSATSNYGTAPGAIAVPAVNANVTNYPTDTTIGASGAVSAADVASVTTASQNGQNLITGTPTANSVLSFSGNSGFQTGWLQCTGTFSSSDVFSIETSGDGTNWVVSSAYLASGNQTVMSTFSLPFTKALVNLTGTQYLRIRATSWTSGSPVCTLRVTASLQALHITGTSSTASNGNAAAATSTLTGTVGSGAAGIGVQNPLVQADSSAAISLSGAASTQLVAGTASKQIWVTSWNVMSAGTATFTLGYATSGGCASPTALTGAYPLTAQAGIATGSGLGSLYTLPAGYDLCGTDSASVQMSGSISYVKY